MNPLDPAVAALRCWEHEDCLEHPELALACANGVSTSLSACVSDDFAQPLSVDPTYGGGYSAFGNGWGCGDVGVGEDHLPGGGFGGGRDACNRNVTASDCWADGDGWGYGPWLNEDNMTPAGVEFALALQMHLEGW